MPSQIQKNKEKVALAKRTKGKFFPERLHVGCQQPPRNFVKFDARLEFLEAQYEIIEALALQRGTSIPKTIQSLVFDAINYNEDIKRELHVDQLFDRPWTAERKPKIPTVGGF